jgi:hypothetical protein
VTDERLTHLHDVGRLLWPAPLEMSVASEAQPTAAALVHREYVVVPSSTRPRLLVPAGRRAAASALRRYGVGGSRLARWRANGLAVGASAGILPLVMRDRIRLYIPNRFADPADAIESHLAEVFGHEVLISMHIGAPRANRKPVLQVLTPAGSTIAYVKVGVDSLTRELVRNEAAALGTLRTSGLVHTHTPTVLHSGQWNDLELLVQSALPVQNGRARPTARQVTRSQIEVAAIDAQPDEALAGSAYWKALSMRVEALAGERAGRRLAVMTRRIAEEVGEVAVPFGSWHGDWTPWNTARFRRRLLVWDWERFARGVPVGYDTLHSALQTDLVTRGIDPRRAADDHLARAHELLRPFGFGPHQARAVSMGYLVELAARYLTDRQQEAGARLGDVAAWLLPAAESALTSPHGHHLHSQGAP